MKSFPENSAHFPADAFDNLAQVEAGNWWFRARNRLLLWVLKKKLPPFRSFLEVGCGTGYVLEGVNEAFPGLDLFGSEYFEEGLAHARARIPNAIFTQLDATRMDEVDRYDVIGAFDVIEHIEDDETVLKNLWRALKNNGAVLITVPQHRWLWSEADVHAGHFRRYRKGELSNKLEEAGFSIEYMTSFVFLLAPLMWLSRVRAKKGKYDPMAEFKIPRWINSILNGVMDIEFCLLRIGINLPFGGSLLAVARKL